MRTLLLLLLGVGVGVIGTLMFFTIENPYESPGPEGPGGGNARLSLDEETIALLLEGQVRRLEAFGEEAVVGARVHPHGLIEVNIGVIEAPAGSTINLELDPEVIDGQLEIVVASAQVGGLIAPREIADIVERQLQEQLAGLAAGFDYRLTAIMTTDQRLTLEIEI